MDQVKHGNYQHFKHGVDSKSLSKAYKRQRRPSMLMDDAAIGIDPTKDTILQMGRKAELGQEKWVAVVVALGVAVSGGLPDRHGDS